MLSPEWDPDNGNAEQNSEEKVHKGGPKSAENEPNYIERHSYTTCGAIGISNFCPERPKAD